MLLSTGRFNDRHKIASWTGLALVKEDVAELSEEQTYRRIGLLRYSFLDHESDSDVESNGDMIANSPPGTLSDQDSTGDQESNSEIDEEIPPLPNLFSSTERRTITLV